MTLSARDFGAPVPEPRRYLALLRKSPSARLRWLRLLHAHVAEEVLSWVGRPLPWTEDFLVDFAKTPQSMSELDRRLCAALRDQRVPCGRVELSAGWPPPLPLLLRSSFREFDWRKDWDRYPIALNPPGVVVTDSQKSLAAYVIERAVWHVQDAAAALSHAHLFALSGADPVSREEYRIPEGPADEATRHEIRRLAELFRERAIQFAAHP